jgi:hypothetical protein
MRNLTTEELAMINETIVAVYDTEAHAAAAVNDLENVGIPSNAINQHAKSGVRTRFLDYGHDRAAA